MQAWQERRRVRRAQKRDEILDRALTLVGRQGIEGFSLQTLCREVGFTPAAIYKYVPSREALIVEVQERALVQLRETLAERIALHEPRCSERRVPKRVRPLAGLLLTAVDWVALSVELPEHLALISASLAHPRPLVALAEAERLGPALHATLGLVERQMERAAEAGNLRPGDSRARAGAFFAAIHGVTQTIKLERLDPRAFSTRAVSDLGATLLLGMGATSETIRSAARVLPAEERPRPL
jgi:AcrR family transcriptional regulator